mgnify:CR=1 FL=1
MSDAHLRRERLEEALLPPVVALAIALVSMFALGVGGWLWWWLAGMSAVRTDLTPWTVFVNSAHAGYGTRAAARPGSSRSSRYMTWL